MKKFFPIVACLALMAAQPLSAQKAVRENIKKGNQHYDKSEFLDSEIAYRKALDANGSDSIAQFNLGNSLFRQQKMDDAMKQYSTVAAQAAQAGNKTLSAKAYFNAGDICMAAQDYGQAEELFKQSLRMNPADDEARYNMVLAGRLKKQQEQNKDQNKDQQDKDDQQKQDQQKQDQQKQDQQNQDQQQKDQQKQDSQQQDQKDQQNKDDNRQQEQQQQDRQQEQQQSQPQSGKMSQDQAEAILNAANQEEKDVQDKVKMQLMQQQQRRKTDKEW